VRPADHALVVSHTDRARISRNTFAAGERGVWLPSEVLPELSRTCFWGNRKPPPEAVKALIDAGESLLCDPLFVDPARANFRLRSAAFGYPEDSPLLGAGVPRGVSVGLHPHHPGGGAKPKD